MSFSRPELYENRRVFARHPARSFQPQLDICIRVAAVGVLLAGACQCAWAKPEKAPEWVHEAVAQTLPSYPAETKAVVLLDDTTLTVNPDGKAVEHVRYVVKILRPQGRDEGIIHVLFDNDTKILSMTAWCISPNGQEDVIKEKEMTDIGLPNSGPLYEDYKIRAAQPQSDDPGSIIAYEYEQRTPTYLTEEDWFFQDELPHVTERFTLELPAGYTFGTSWVHHAPVQAADLEHQRWRWEMKDVPAIDLERVPMPPSWKSLAGRMILHYAGPGVAASNDGSWKSIGEWYTRLANDRIAATPEITAKAQELTAGKTDFFDKAESIAKFVQQDVRYFVVERGIGGHQPHFAAEIFRNRYGDCKDKATLLGAMLSAVGIRSVLMDVDTSRGFIDPAAPSVFGDHMIAAIEVPQGYQSPKMHSIVHASNGRTYLIVDPTWDKTPFGQIEHELQGGYGVILDGARTLAVQLPLMEPSLNTISRTAAFHLDADGVLRGTVTEKRFGDVADHRRELYSGHDAKEQQQFLDRVLKQDFTVFSASDVKAENAAALDKDFTLSFNLAAERYAKQMGPLLMLRPRVLGTVNLYLDHKPRHLPIDLEQTMQVIDDYTIELPAGYVVDEMPEPLKLDLDFASYRSELEVKGNILHYKRSFTLKDVELPAERYADLQKLAGVIAADEENQAVLRRQ